MFSFSETGAVERESSAVNQLPTGHAQHGSLLLLHSQLRGTARLDTQRCTVLKGSIKPSCNYFFKEAKNTFLQALVELNVNVTVSFPSPTSSQSKCWWFGAGRATVGSPTRGVGNSGRWRHHHLTRPIQTEDTYVQRKQHNESGNPHIPQHASLHPRQQRTPSSCDCQPAGDPYPASQHASDPDPNTNPYSTTAPAQKESVTHGKVELGSVGS